MREYMGHVLKVLADNFPGPVEGVMVGEKPNMLMLKGKDGKITRVVKSHISGFVPVDFEPLDYVPFQVMFCENEQQGCPGIQYVKEGTGVSKSDCESFMAPCECRAETCKYGTKGEIRTVPGKFLRKMIGGTMYGEYPTKEAGRGDDGENAGQG